MSAPASSSLCKSATAAMALLFAINVSCFADSPAPSSADAQYNWLFVQSGSSGSFDGKTLTLNGVGATLAFTDRPDRIARHMPTSRLIEAGSVGEDNFKEDPPNAVVSVFRGEKPQNATVVLMAPTLEGTTLSYEIKVLEGEIPPSFDEVSLFIDRFGRGAALVGGMAIGHAVSSSNQSSTTTAVQCPPCPACICN